MDRVLILLVLLCVSLLNSCCFAVTRQKRSDDPNALEGVVNNLVSTVEALQAQVQSQAQEIADLKAANNRKVAFSAYCREGTRIPASSSDSVIPFDLIISNVGHHFNALTYVFTAPYDGVYFFILTVNVSPDYEIMAVNKNNHLLFYADKDDSVSTHLAGSAVVTLKAGDIISVHHVARDHGYVECGVDTTFSGFLIR